MNKLASRALPALLALSLMSASAWAQTASTPKPGTAAYNKWIVTALADLQRLSDDDALRNLGYHYGRGNDELSIHHGNRAKGRELAAAEYAQAYAKDIQISVYALGGDKPIFTGSGIPTWVDFADKFFENKKYSSSLHLMSNFSIKKVDANTALVNSYASVPHYILADKARDKASAAPILEYMLCRYDYEAKRQADGSWKMSKLTIRLEEIATSEGFYAGGQSKGL
jgi:hypothetical protein